jgi:hypothetical protein
MKWNSVPMSQDLRAVFNLHMILMLPTGTKKVKGYSVNVTETVSESGCLDLTPITTKGFDQIKSPLENLNN